MLHTGSQGTSNRDDARGWGLQVLFLAGGNGVAAQLAANWARLLAKDEVEVEAASPDGSGSAAVLDFAPTGLIVVIQAPGCSGPLVAHHCGGRIDWHLTVDLNKATSELSSQLFRHIMGLLGELGVSRLHSGPTVMPRSCLPEVLDRSTRTNPLASLRAA